MKIYTGKRKQNFIFLLKTLEMDTKKLICLPSIIKSTNTKLSTFDVRQNVIGYYSKSHIKHKFSTIICVIKNWQGNLVILHDV